MVLRDETLDMKKVETHEVARGQVVSVERAGGAEEGGEGSLDVGGDEGEGMPRAGARLAQQRADAGGGEGLRHEFALAVVPNFTDEAAPHAEPCDAAYGVRRAASRHGASRAVLGEG